jgi:two-component system NarL family sensor kinase
MEKGELIKPAFAVYFQMVRNRLFIMKRAIILFLVICFSAAASNAQQHLVDSITKELQHPMADSSRAVSMMRLAIDYEIVDTSKAYQSYKEAIHFAHSKNLDYNLGRIYQNASFLYATGGNYDKSIEYLDSAIYFYGHSTDARAARQQSITYNDIASRYQAINQTEKAIEYYLKGIGQFEQLKLDADLVLPYCNVATLFGDIKQYDQQNEYGGKALAAAKRTGIRQKIFLANYIMSYAAGIQENAALAKRYIDSARVYYDEQSLINSVDMHFSFFLVTAQTFNKLKQLDSAAYFFKKAYEVSATYNYNYGKAESQLQLGGILVQQKKYGEAENYLLNGIRLADSIGYYNMLDEGYKYLSDVYAVTGRYKQAYEYLQKFKDASDSLNNLETKKSVTDLEKKYETSKKDKQIVLQQSQLQKRKTLNYILIGSAIILLIFSFLVYRFYNQKKKLQQQRIKELEALHQLTATEAVLKGEEQERTRLAKDLHDGLGGMLSGIKFSFQTVKGNLIMTPDNQQAFERSMDMLDSSIKEIRRVAHNMMPEALLKFGLDAALKGFCNDITQSGALAVSYQSIGMTNEVVEQTMAVNIYRIVQELINNTLKHASAKTAIVQVSKKGDAFSLTVEDDGKGFNPVILQGTKGIGWGNIQSRVEYLKGKWDVQAGPDKGTSVHIELNL